MQKKIRQPNHMRAAHAAFSQGLSMSQSEPDLHADINEDNVQAKERKSSWITKLVSKTKSKPKPNTTINRDLVLQPGCQISDKELNSMYEIQWEEPTTATVNPPVPPTILEEELLSSLVAAPAVTRNFKLYRAIETTSREACALKIVDRNDLKVNPVLMATLRKEALLVSHFEMQPHPNICFPIKVSETRTKVAVELDLINGGDLLDFLLGFTNNSPNKIFKWVNELHPGKIFTQILRAVEFCHNNKIIHGDVKPDNVLMTRKGVYLPGTDMVSPIGCIYKLCDFGSSQIVPGGVNNGKLSGIRVGTPGYVAPEVVNDGIISYASDMWSLGCLLYVLLR